MGRGNWTEKGPQGREDRPWPPGGGMSGANGPVRRKVASIEALDHNLGEYFTDLRRFSSTKVLEASSLYAGLKTEVERVLGSVVQGDLSDGAPPARPAIRVTAWNIERGIRMEDILRVLKEHPLIRESDFFLITELDHGMARTQNRFVAHEMARALGLHYVFAPCYLSLVKGSGAEDRVEGENAQALHGNALFSRYPLRDAHMIPLPNGKDKMRGKEKRLGCQKVVIATVDHPLGPVRAVSLHLDAHSSQKHRYRQMKMLLDHLERLGPALPVIVGGDWNTSTYNSSRAVYSILGFFRRVLIGADGVIRNHYPYPDRWFERHLFRELERRGYRYRDLNEPGECTLHYNVRDLMMNSGLADWIPQWCFWFINWALKDHQGRCSLKLDWFAGKDIVPVPDLPSRVLGDVREAYGRLSDHDPIVLDFLPQGL